MLTSSQMMKRRLREGVEFFQFLREAPGTRGLVLSSLSPTFTMAGLDPAT